MNRRRLAQVAALSIAAALVAGCHGDPNVRKLKYLESGRRYSAEGKYREAAIQFSNALKIDKDYPDAHYELGQTYAHLGELNAAYTELESTVDLQPSNAKARLDLASVMLAGGRTDEALMEANSVMAVQPGNPDVHSLLSAIDHERGQDEQALVEIHRALQLDPGRAAFHEDLAMLQFGDPAKASQVEAELKKSLAADPKSVNARLLLASLYAKSGRWADAEKSANDAVNTNPDSVSARQSLAQVYFKEGKQAKAEEILTQASQDLAANPQGVVLLANYYAAAGQMEKAKAQFAALAAKYPKNSDVQEGYIRTLLDVNDFATAQKVVAGLMKSSDTYPEVAGLNGILLLNAGKTNDAVNALTEATRSFPNDAFLEYWLGKAALAKGDNGLAEKSFRDAAALNPSRLDAQQELAQIATLHGDMDLLSEVANRTITASPSFPGGYVWRAEAELNRNSLDKAEADLKTAQSFVPQNSQVSLEFGKLRLAQKRLPEGVSLLENALQLNPDSTEAVRLLVSNDLSQHQPDKALALLNAQIQKRPKNSSFEDLLARLQVQNKNFDQASAIARKAIQLNPNDGEAVMLFAQIQILRGDTANAVHAWEDWLNAHPNDAGALAGLGTLEESLGDQSKAEDCYRKSLQIQPSNSVAANNLAYLMLQNGDNVDVALTLAQTARQGMPDSPNTADTLAWAYYYKGTYGFARDLLEDAAKSDPNNATMQYHLGMVYRKLSDRTSAVAHLKKAVSLARDPAVAKDAKAALQGLG